MNGRFSCQVKLAMGMVGAVWSDGDGALCLTTVQQSCGVTLM